MPDFERLHRKLYIYTAKTAQEKEILITKFDKQDHLRWQIVCIVSYIAIVCIFISWFLGRT